MPIPSKLSDLQRQQGAVLQRAHELLQADNSMKIGEAVKRAVEAADCPMPQDIQDAMVRALGKMLFQGFPSDIDA
jgi:hypothetical protein